ncbi:MAG: hydrogenase maturation protease [Elusimicrobiales bacterium]|nr:hydrogenase maturation protease [Elusimicrobiales bacterium]
MQRVCKDSLTNFSDFVTSLLKGEKIVVVCLGNDLRSDDGIGPYIARKIKNDKFIVINAGQSFENHIYEIFKYEPSDLIIIDAAFFGQKVGEIALLNIEDISSVKMVSTHSIPINFLIEIIKNELPDINVIIFGIQVLDTSFGENIKKEVKEAGDFLVDLLNSL